MNMSQFSEASLMLFFFLWCVRGTLAGIITNPPSVVTTFEGRRIQLVCIVQELEDGEVVSWFKDTVKVSEGTQILYPQPNRYSIDDDKVNGHYFLVIDPVKRTDRDSKFACGIYKGDEEIDKTDEVKIVVKEIPNPKYPECLNKETEYISGNTVTLLCTSEIVDPMPSMRWLADETIYETTNSRSREISTLYLKLRITSDLDGKIFICNLRGETVERNCTVGPLNVVYQPQIQLNGESMVKEGNVYICSVKANPRVNGYKWTFKPEINEDQYKIETGDQTLRLNKFYPSQNGTVMQCEATNRIGTSTVSKILYLPSSNNPAPSLSSNVGKQSKDTSKMSSTKILSFVGSSLLLLACLMAVLLCVFVAHSRRYLPGVRVPQPDVYFMPKDSISTMGRNAAQTTGVWKRSIGTQVPSDLDRESIYLEIGERKTLM